MPTYDVNVLPLYRNLIIYAGGERFRIDGKVAF